MFTHSPCNNTQPHRAHSCYGVSEAFADAPSASLAPEEQVKAQMRGLSRIMDLNIEWWNQFKVAYEAYGEGAADFQGIAGQWGDLYRKTMYLRNWAWAGGQEPTRETPRAVLLDIIGHAFLAIEMIDRGMPGGRH